MIPQLVAERKLKIILILSLSLALQALSAQYGLPTGFISLTGEVYKKPVRGIASVNPPLEVTIVSAEKAKEIFKWIKESESLRQTESIGVEDRWARVHKITQLLEQDGILAAKIFLRSKNSQFKVKTADQSIKEWSYHVAPILLQKNKNGENKILVLDSYLFSEPVSVGTWRDQQMMFVTPADAETLYRPRFSALPESSQFMKNWAIEDIRKMDDVLKTSIAQEKEKSERLPSGR